MQSKGPILLMSLPGASQNFVTTFLFLFSEGQFLLLIVHFTLPCSMLSRKRKLGEDHQLHRVTLVAGSALQHSAQLLNCDLMPS